MAEDILSSKFHQKQYGYIETSLKTSSQKTIWLETSFKTRSTKKIWLETSLKKRSNKNNMAAPYTSQEPGQDQREGLEMRHSVSQKVCAGYALHYRKPGLEKPGKPPPEKKHKRKERCPLKRDLKKQYGWRHPFKPNPTNK